MLPFSTPYFFRPIIIVYFSEPINIWLIFCPWRLFETGVRQGLLLKYRLLFSVWVRICYFEDIILWNDEYATWALLILNISRQTIVEAATLNEYSNMTENNARHLHEIPHMEVIKWYSYCNFIWFVEQTTGCEVSFPEIRQLLSFSYFSHIVKHVFVQTGRRIVLQILIIIKSHITRERINN